MARPIVPQPVATRGNIDPDGPLPVGWKRTRSGKVKRRNIVWRMRRVLVGLVAFAVLAVSAVGAQLWASVKPPTGAKPPQSSFMCTADVNECTRDTAFAELALADSGQPVKKEDIPQVLVYAVVAAEDRDFFTHQGVDPSGIARAILHDVRSDGGQQGGSTITQQLVKNLTGADSRTVGRKVTEAVQAMKIEREAADRPDGSGKLQIITDYLNSIYFGRNSKGIDSAVRAYFGPGKRVKDLGLQEASYLAAIIRDPNAADANLKVDNPERDDQLRYAKTLRGRVLDAMLTEGYITQADHDTVKEMPFDYVIPEGETTRGKVREQEAAIGGTLWRDYVQQWILDQGIANGAGGRITKEDLQTRGLRIYTSMNPLLQAAATDAVAKVLTTNTPDEIKTGLAAVDSQGYLRAMVGNRDARSNGFNYATQTMRQVGSSYKPILLAQYLASQDHTIDDRFDSPAEYPGRPGSGDKPLKLGAGEAPKQQIDLVEALAESSNTVFGQVLDAVTPGNVTPHNKPAIDFGTGLGVPASAYAYRDAKKNAENSNLLAIGGPVHTSPLGLAYAYSTLANGGERAGSAPLPVQKITTATGELLYQPAMERSAVLSRNVAEQVDYAMTQVVESPNGTGNKNVKVPGQVIAGKTGTVALSGTESDGNNPNAKVENSNAWFTGFTCKLTASVWLGKDGSQAIGRVEGVDNVNGGTIPAMIFSRFMTAATQNETRCPFDRPEGSFRPTTTVASTSTTRDKQDPKDRDDRPWWERDKPTTTDPDWTTWTPPTRPSTTERPGRTTTTRPGGPGQSSTTATTRFKPF